MTKITFVEYGGAEHLVDAQDGKSVMQAALDNNIAGIIGECGGTCACATCHAYIAQPWLATLPAKSEDEAAMLEGALDVKSGSRLTCQIKIVPELEGMIVRLPKAQQ